MNPSYQDQLIKLRELLTEKFSITDLKILCFDLSIDPSTLGEKKEQLIIGLITYSNQRNKIGTLLDRIEHNRSDIDLTILGIKKTNVSSAPTLQANNPSTTPPIGTLTMGTLTAEGSPLPNQTLKKLFTLNFSQIFTFLGCLSIIIWLFTASTKQGFNFVPFLPFTKTPTPTSTPTETPTSTPTETPTPTNAPTKTPTSTLTETPTPTKTPTKTPTSTPTETLIPTNTPTFTSTPTKTQIPPTATPRSYVFTFFDISIIRTVLTFNWDSTLPTLAENQWYSVQYSKDNGVSFQDFHSVEWIKEKTYTADMAHVDGGTSGDLIFRVRIYQGVPDDHDVIGVSQHREYFVPASDTEGP